MENEAYSSALKSTLDEILKVCPDIKDAFLFREDGEIIRANGNTSEENSVRTVDALDSILEKAGSLGGVEEIVLEGSKGRVNVSHVMNFYLVTITPTEADTKRVNTVTRIVVPTVIGLLQKISPTPFTDSQSNVRLETKTFTFTRDEDQAGEAIEQTESKERKGQQETEFEHALPEAPVNQFIVEDVRGLLVSADTVRIDNDLLVQWEELFEGKKIEMAEIETFGGKSIQCKVKPIKNSKYEGQGKIQLPHKIQTALEIKKGELVRVKPVID